MKYHVEINYKKGPSFSTDGVATCAELAKADALSAARRMGFNSPVKKITVRELK